MSDDEAGQEEQPDVPPKVPFDAKTMECVLDVRALCGLPMDTEEDGVLAFRALLLPKGKTLHVPGEPGCYATLGPWQTQIALSEVHFLAATKRKPELLLAFADNGMLSSNMTGVFVMSLQLPLQKARNVFEETPRFTKIADVSGFTPIDVKVQPWCSLLEPALKRHAIYEDQKLYSPADIIKHMRCPLETRIEALAKSTRKAIAEKVKELGRQDKRLAEKASARMEAQLDKAHEFLKALPPRKYDKRTEERVIVIKLDDASKGPAWLTTPKRGALEAGAAVCKPTVCKPVPKPNFADPAADPAADVAAAAPTVAAGPATAAAAAPVTAVSDDDDDDDDSDIDFDCVPLDVVGAKRSRKAVLQFDPTPPAKKTEGLKSKAKAVSAIPKHTLPAAPHTRHSPSPKRPTAGAVPQDELRAMGINPRTKKPFERKGGAYKTTTKGPAQVLKAAEQAQKAAAKKEIEKETIATLRAQVATLDAQLKAEQAAGAVAVEKAKLEATQAMHADLLSRYRDGLRDGASLSRGRGSASLASDSPASGVFA